MSYAAFPVSEAVTLPAVPDPLSPAGALRLAETQRMAAESAVEALCRAFDMGGMEQAQRLYEYEDDAARMEFGRRRRAQLFELGWIV